MLYNIYFIKDITFYIKLYEKIYEIKISISSQQDQYSTQTTHILLTSIVILGLCLLALAMILLCKKTSKVEEGQKRPLENVNVEEAQELNSNVD